MAKGFAVMCAALSAVHGLQHGSAADESFGRVKTGIRWCGNGKQAWGATWCKAAGDGDQKACVFVYYENKLKAYENYGLDDGCSIAHFISDHVAICFDESGAAPSYIGEGFCRVSAYDNAEMNFVDVLGQGYTLSVLESLRLEEEEIALLKTVVNNTALK